MRFSLSILLGVASATDLSGSYNDKEFHLPSPEGFFEKELKQFACTLEGRDQPSCDASAAEDGSGCVWCTLVSFGVCVTETEAQQMKSLFPLIKCDDEENDDDDDDEIDDDDSGPEPEPFFACLESTTSEECSADTSDDCAWCTTKTGVGICMDPTAQAEAEDSYWFDCSGDQERTEMTFTEAAKEDEITSITDSTCTLSASKDLESCMNAVDAQGNPCEWCSVNVVGHSLQLCVGHGQAVISTETMGAVCTSGDDNNSEAMKDATKGAVPTEVSDVVDSIEDLDLSCLLATLDGTADACLASEDADGHSCEFCSWNGQVDICLSPEQAGMVEIFGVTCEASSDMEAEEDVLEHKDIDLTCALASNTDAKTCEALIDNEGNPCQFCSLQSILNVCLSVDAASFVQKIGAQCHGMTDPQEGWEGEKRIVSREEEVQDKLPVGDLDLSCLFATIDGTKEACLSSEDAEGHSCEFCSWNGQIDICLSPEQAGMVEIFGVTCEASSDMEEEEEEEDLFDMTCLYTSLDDEEECQNTWDENGDNCQFCKFAPTDPAFNLCLPPFAADLVSSEFQFVHCNNPVVSSSEDGEEIEEQEGNEMDPDISCIAASLFGEAACQATSDTNGNPCEYCSWNDAAELCLTETQAIILETFGVTCGDYEDGMKEEGDYDVQKPALVIEASN